MTGRRAFVAAAAVLALSLAACSGGSGDSHESNSPSTTSASGGADAAKQALCNDLLLIQSGFRPDALQRFHDRLKEDQAAFKAAGDQATAKQIALVAAATTKLRQALLDQKNVPQAQQAFAKAIEKLPTC